jgi:CTP:molybdopterin cytidylyltransferase MocA
MARPVRVAGVVPCAGASERMGTEKALLDAAGATFVERVVEALRFGGCGPVFVVVSDAGSRTAEMAKRAGAQVLVNLDPGEGPITSLRIALLMLDGAADAVAFCPVDHPLVRPRTVRRLVEAFARDRPPLVLPAHGGRHGHPTLFDRSLFPELADPTLEGGARTVVHAHLDEAVLVPVDDAGTVTDIDTPDEYLRAMGGGLL